MATQPFLFSTPKMDVVQLSTASGTSWQTLATGAANGSKIVGLSCVSESTVAQVVQVSLQRSATNYKIGSVSAAASAGNDGTTAAVDLLGSTLLPQIPTDSDAEHYLFLQSTSDVLQVQTTVLLPAGRLIHIVAVRADG